MIELEVAGMLFKLCFAGGFCLAMLLTVLVIGLFFAVRLWTLRDDLKDISEEVTGLLRELEKEGE